MQPLRIGEINSGRRGIGSLRWNRIRCPIGGRRRLRQPSDLTDGAWAPVAPMIRPAMHGGRPHTVEVREALGMVFHVLSARCQWSALPKSTVWDDVSRWEWDDNIERIHHAPYVAMREQPGLPSDRDHRQPGGKGGTKAGATLDPSG
ncbi:transposase [Falsiroseomonas sp. HC035]|uniref:transposase n=1 Tax=Falsiroseomonas sp. HC035 TaxID=3390999 RepID=UPI003D324099